MARLSKLEKTLLISWGGVCAAILFYGIARASRREIPVDEKDEPIDPERAEPEPPVAPPVRAGYVTPHFEIREFAQHASKKCGTGVVPYPSAWIQTRLRPLCEALEAIRSALGGRAIEINSGYRSAYYNANCIAGGATNSQHVHGRAADIVVPGVLPSVVARTARALHNRGVIRIGGLGHYRSLTHVDIRPTTSLVEWYGK